MYDVISLLPNKEIIFRTWTLWTWTLFEFNVLLGHLILTALYAMDLSG
jgi:hypothetical protein